MSSDSALELSRQQTRERLLRSLYRSNVRQQAVARRRTTVRQIALVARWVVGLLTALAIVLWSSMQMGLLPQWRIVTAEQLHLDAAAAPMEQIAVTQHQQEDTEAAEADSRAEAHPTDDLNAGPTDDQETVGLKAETQLHSLMQ